MTWREFKEFVEARGVSDDDEVEWIDVSSYLNDLHIDRVEKDGVVYLTMWS